MTKLIRHLKLSRKTAIATVDLIKFINKQQIRMGNPNKNQSSSFRD